MTKLFQHLYFPANRPLLLLLLVAKFIGAFFRPGASVVDRIIAAVGCCRPPPPPPPTTSWWFVAGGSKTKFPAEKKTFFFLSFFLCGKKVIKPKNLDIALSQLEQKRVGCEVADELKIGVACLLKKSVGLSYSYILFTFFWNIVRLIW